jgi:hypothetical protein
VVIEDVDLAPFEVLAALVPLLEERRLYVPGRGESVPAADGFQLFGTVTTGGGRSGGSAAAGARADPLAGLWARVAVEPPVGFEPAAVGLFTPGCQIGIHGSYWLSSVGVSTVENNVKSVTPGCQIGVLTAKINVVKHANPTRRCSAACTRAWSPWRPPCSPR